MWLPGETWACEAGFLVCAGLCRGGNKALVPTELVSALGQLPEAAGQWYFCC